MCWWHWGPAAFWAPTVYRLQNAEFSPWLRKVVLSCLCVHGKKCIYFLEAHINSNHISMRSVELGFLMQSGSYNKETSHPDHPPPAEQPWGAGSCRWDVRCLQMQGWLPTAAPNPGEPP